EDAARLRRRGTRGLPLRSLRGLRRALRRPAGEQGDAPRPRRNLLALHGLTGPRGLLVCAPLSSLGTSGAPRPGPARSRPDSGGDVAQLGERLVRNEEVVGSIPIISTKFFEYRGPGPAQPGLVNPVRTGR